MENQPEIQAQPETEGVPVQKSRNSRDVSDIPKKVINNMEFMSIQDEEYREYIIPVEGRTYTVRINKPQWLFVRPSGTHMIEDSDGVMHYIPPFVHFAWKNRTGAPAANF